MKNKKMIFYSIMLLIFFTLVSFPKESLAKVTGTWGNVSWEFEGDVITFTTGGNLGQVETAPWYKNSPLNGAKINKIVFTKITYTPKESRGLLGDSSNVERERTLSNLKEIEGLEFIKTNNTTSFFYMFQFTSLKKLDISSFETSRVKDMRWMFTNTANHPKGLEELDISSLTMSSDSSYEGLLYDQDKLKKLTLGKGFRGSKGKSYNIVKLPPITQKGYTGKWIHEETGTNVGTSYEFMKNYDGSLPGTYVWEKEEVTPVWGNVPWKFDKESGILTFLKGGKFTGYNDSPWNREDEYKISAMDIKKIVFNDKTFAPKDSSYLFSASKGNKLENLENIENISFLDVTEVTNMSYMFMRLSSIKELDLSSFNTNNVENMYGLFLDMSSLEYLDISNFSREKNPSLGQMFLKTKIKKINLGKDFSTKGQKPELPGIVKKDGYTGNWIKEDTKENVGSSLEFMQAYDGSKPGTYVWERKVWGDVPWDFDEKSGVLTFLENGKLAGYKESPWNTKEHYKIKGRDIKKIVFKDRVIAPEHSAYLFSSISGEQLENLESIENVSFLDTSEVNNMSNMFMGPMSLEKLDLSTFNTTNVTNMHQMFRENSVGELNISSFTVTSTTSVDYMFYKANIKKFILGEKFSVINKNTTLPEISSINGYTGNWMKENTQENVGPSNKFMQEYDGSKPGTYVWERRVWGDVPWEFDEKSGVLTFLEKGQFARDTESPWNIEKHYKIPGQGIKRIVFKDKVLAPDNSEFLFSSNDPKNQLGNLLDFEGIKYLDTSNTTNMAYMFQGIKGIKQLDLSTMNTDNVTIMRRTFSNMTNLERLNISNFNTTNVGMLGGFFENNVNLREIKLGNKFSTKDRTGLLSPALPDMSKEMIKSTDYTGNWVYVDDGYNSVGNSTTFMKNYDGSQPGTYIWEKKVEKIELKSVPKSYDFDTTLKPKDYSLESNVTKDNQLIVHNNMINTNWSVKATFVNKELKSNADSSKTFKVEKFAVDNNDILSIGNKGILAKSPDIKNQDNNYGDIITKIKNIKLSFVDKNGELKSGNQLYGTIRYQLYNTSTAE